MPEVPIAKATPLLPNGHDAPLLILQEDSMPSERDDDLAIPLFGAAALLRQDFRYLRSSVEELKSIVRDELATKADKSELSNEEVRDHEQRIRKLEGRFYWAMGFSAAIGGVVGILSRVIFH